MSLVETRKDGYLVVRCKHCNTVLAEIQEDGKKASVVSGCKHFQWEQVSWLCFHKYFEHPECDADFLFDLRRKYLVRIDDGERYFLLVPRPREAEEQ
jgi:hypothetical protein